MGTKPETFSIAQLDDYRSQKADASYHLELPTFQRGLVWPAAKKTNLIRSISNDYPIGALLMYEKPAAVGKSTKMLQVIDGLQRSTAILDYLKEPLKIAPVADEFIDWSTYDETVELLSEIGIETKAELIRDLIRDWAHETKQDKPVKGFQASAIRKKLESHFDLNFERKHCDVLEELFTEDIIQKLDDTFQRLRNYQIPVILYSGPEENLPEIFEALNTGTPLTKYDKFGATWSGHSTVTKTKEIRDAVTERYKIFVERDWEVSNFDPTTPLGENDLNLFEYLVGLGHLLCERNPALFAAASYESEAPSCAFALATLCHGLRLSDMDQLPKKVKKSSSGPIDLSAFEKAILSSAAAVNAVLNEFLSLKLNTKAGGGRFLPHSDLQVISLIARYAIETHDSTTWQPLASTQSKQLLDNIHVHYFIDILKENWKGSGDSRAYRTVWDEDQNKHNVRGSYYMQKPSAEEFAKALDEFHQGELAKKQFDRPNISTKTKVMLRLLYADIITHLESQQIVFHIEHLFPVKKLTDLLKRTKNSTGLPISAFGNLAILSDDDNWIKGENFIGDFIATDGDKVTDIPKVEKFVITPVEEITEANLDSEEAYLSFAKTRFEAQKSVIMANLKYTSDAVVNGGE